MNIITPLIPVAAAALGTVVQSVGDVLQSGKSFAHLLHDSLPEIVGGEKDSSVADSAPQQSELGQQVQHEALRQQFDAQRQLIHQRLIARFAEQGIDLSEPAVLSVDSNGRLLEGSGHWDRGKIEELLQSDAGLRTELGQLLQLGTALGESGPAGAENGRGVTPRLVVSEKEIFFQVV